MAEQSARAAYRRQCGAYRARRRQAHAIGMYYASAPLNTDRLADAAAEKAELAALPEAPKPKGFDDHPLDLTFRDLPERRRRLLANRRHDRAELERRGTERALNERLGITGCMPYIVTDASLRDGDAVRTRIHLRAVRGNPWPLMNLRWQEEVIDFVVEGREFAARLAA